MRMKGGMMKAAKVLKCWYYENRTCTFLTNCKQDHPEQCISMLETGLFKDSRCELIHPKIWRNSFLQKILS